MPTFPTTVAVTPWSFIDVATMRALLGVDDSVDDNLIAKFINWATAGLERMTLRKLLRRTYLGAGDPNATPPKEAQLLASGDGTPSIYIPEWPAAITACRARLPGGGTQVIDLANAWSDSAGRVDMGAFYTYPLDVNLFPWGSVAFPTGRLNLEIDCVAGYDAALFPTDFDSLQHCSARICEVIYQDWKLRVGRGSVASAAGGTVNLIPAAMPKDVQDTVRRYRRIM